MKLLLSVLALCLSAASLRADSLEAILKRMDQAAPSFHALSATIAMDTYQAILDSHTPETGTLRMQRLKKNDVRAILDFKGTDARTIAVIGNVVEIYTPKLKLVQKTNVGSKSEMLNQFLLLGFGSSGSELAQSYIITAEGEEKVAGTVTTKLQLIPKDPEVKKQLSKVEIWIPEAASYPIEQKFYRPAQPSDNCRLVTYSDVAVNPPMTGKLDLKLPAGVKEEKQ